MAGRRSPYVDFASAQARVVSGLGRREPLRHEVRRMGEDRGQPLASRYARSRAPSRKR